MVRLTDLGILPNDVIRDPEAESAMVFVDLGDGLSEAQLREWLSHATEAMAELESHQGRDKPYASATFALGLRFFNRLPDHADRNPAGLTTPPATPVAPETHDAVFHVMFTSESVLADFLKLLWATRPVLHSIFIERGYQRRDKRENFGELDGLRNIVPRGDRAEVVTVDSDKLPEEPAWLTGGSYLAYLKIEQFLDTWSSLSPGAQEAALGRRHDDGSRLDLPPGTDPHSEPEFGNDAVPPANSHVRKAGPRGVLHDQTRLLRRGTPYAEAEGGELHVGLQFVSYQATLDDFDVIFNNWMLNLDFPHQASQVDALFLNNSLAQVIKAGFYVVPPIDHRFLGAGYFDAVPAPKPAKKGRVHVRKRMLDTNGQPARVERGGFQFGLFDDQGGQLGNIFTTNSAGHATSDEVPVGVPLTLRELNVPAAIESQGDVAVTLERANQTQPYDNRVKPGSIYGVPS